MRVLQLLVTVSIALSCAGQSVQRLKDDLVPGKSWQQATPEAVGYSSAKLEALRAWLKVQDTSAMMVIVQGRVIFSYGDVSHTSIVASARKSILSMLYGNYVVSGKIDTSKTVVELGLEDGKPFLPIEANAKLEQLMAGRSGIYLLQQDDDLPKRGTHFPGTYYQYQNWDFNAAGTAFEKLTGRNIYDALETDLARPLEMEDFVRADQHKVPEPGSTHPIYHMTLSTRDTARLGLLMLDYGSWNGKSLVPADWVRYITSLITPFHEINPSSLQNAGEPERWGFGSMWWVWDQPAFVGNVTTGFMQGAYSAMGTGGNFITVLPSKDMVVVHKVDIDRNARASVSPSSYMAMLAMIANSQCQGECR